MVSEDRGQDEASALAMEAAGETGLPFGPRSRTDWPDTDLHRQPAYLQEAEVRMLKEEAEALKDELNAIERRMNELANSKRTEE